jgi:sigma-B regulation protein RsbU (phosphoserine phosphatase)
MAERMVGEGIFTNAIKNQLVERKSRLNEAVRFIPDSVNLFNLLKQVDLALERLDNGTYGICEVCKDPIETERLLADPLMTLCLDHLDTRQQRALELDLEYAGKIQRALLPKNNIKTPYWEYSYRYQPAGTVSGDFCDFIENADNSLTFILGDVSGKGVSASLMMSNLHALIHSLLSFNLPINEIMMRANRLFCESTLATNYATMVMGKVLSDGTLYISVAGHNPPLISQNGKVTLIEATGIPVGMFCEAEYGVEQLHLERGDSLLLYTDGLSEASVNGNEYGEENIKNQIALHNNLSPADIIRELLSHQKLFTGDSIPADDVTIGIIKKL